MGDTVPIQDVIHVLRAHGVTMSPVDGEPNTYVVESDGFLEQIAFTDQVGKRRLQYLSRKLSIAIHLFWNPTQVLPVKASGKLQ